MKIKSLVSVLVLVMALLSTSVLAINICNTSVSTVERDYTYVDNTTYNITSTMGGDSVWYGWYFFTPRLNFTVFFNDTGTIVNGSTQVLDYRNVTAGSVHVFNASNLTREYGTGNFSLNAGRGWLTWTTTVSNLNNTNVVIVYNKTMIKNVDDLVTGYNLICNGCDGMVEISPAVPTWGETVSFRLKDDQLAKAANSSGYAVGYYVETRTCTARDSCRQTQTVIFAAMTLLALLCIVAGGYLLVQAVSGEGGTGGALMAGAIGLIGFAIAIIVGIVIIGQVGYTVCQAVI